LLDKGAEWYHVSVFGGNKAHQEALKFGFQPPVADSRAFIEHYFGRLDLVGVAIFVGEIDYFTDTGLDNDLRTFIAREESDINPAIA